MVCQAVPALRHVCLSVRIRAKLPHDVVVTRAKLLAQSATLCALCALQRRLERWAQLHATPALCQTNHRTVTKPLRPQAAVQLP